jgi:hypothetical protein
MCHAPRNLLMATKSGGMTGGSVGSWYAPNITSDKVSGIGGWSDEELASYLKTGIAGDKACAAGLMAEAVENSFQHMSDDDIKAMIAYLRTLPAEATPGQTKTNFEHGSAGSDVLTVRGSRPMGHELTETEGAHSTSRPAPAAIRPMVPARRTRAIPPCSTTPRRARPIPPT